MTTESIDSAFEEGRNACELDIEHDVFEISDNPYPVGDPRHEKWIDGYIYQDCIESGDY